MKIFEIIPFPALIVSLVATVNILTEVTKRIVTVKKAERVVVAWSVVLSIAISIVGAVLEGFVTWGMMSIACVVGAILGALVSYVAMFGYDELYENAIKFIGSGFGYLKTKKEGDEDAKQP